MHPSPNDPLEAFLIGPADPEIVSLESALRQAQLDADVARLDALLADDLVFTGPDGVIGTKEQDLAAHQSGAVRFRRHDVEDLRIRRVGLTVAICALGTHLVVEVAGTPVSGWFRYTRVWELQHDGAWRVVGGHVSAVPGPPTPNDA